MTVGECAAMLRRIESVVDVMTPGVEVQTSSGLLVSDYKTFRLNVCCDRAVTPNGRWYVETTEGRISPNRIECSVIPGGPGSPRIILSV